MKLPAGEICRPCDWAHHTLCSSSPQNFSKVGRSGLRNSFVVVMERDVRRPRWVHGPRTVRRAS
jgi:hypothetical protein